MNGYFNNVSVKTNFQATNRNEKDTNKIDNN